MEQEATTQAADLIDSSLQKIGISDLSFLSTTVLQNTVLQWIIALFLFLFFSVLLHGGKKILISRLHTIAKKTKWKIDDVVTLSLKNISSFFYFSVSLFFSVQHLALSNVISLGIRAIFLFAIVFEVIKIVEVVVKALISIKFKKSDTGAKNLTVAVGLIVRIVLWSVGLLLILSNMGVNVTSLIASMGIGGLAVSLALQPLFQDMFSSFSIILDKPFEEGDFVVYGEFSGTVKSIGLKTTRMEALQGEEVIISNSELTNSKIQNFKKLKKRRIVFGFGVTYDTPHKKLKKIPAMIKKIAKEDALIQMDRVHFKEFADSSLNFEVVYFIKSADYTDYMNSQQKMNLAIVEVFEKEGIEMAFPTRTVHLVNQV
ncbi:mechanosensitive ion channel family protein [Candidatus Peregrinibacteria bacterium]|jgi:small-conductance mechanosensitive channel|nr:mechanosensitive ion channel family protein [Candidatus Peregrinibacteria bacterium]MBT3598587.1 mechanosensitive ion channel family protein [Candidatus Peregrinibacteria bacterium]MBT4367188.1 mechanosensitive ion channel family protein [Candidatus Peregrinibacteria bacterium]MBT4586107.1 mechanosensitive ion channel family protein [Candidatus Peregrinibacteria bacterium]MBT6730582.1 mechanosensitive ion channel family protein [Candidatus Peregrinibacteria bacterium]